MGWLQEYSRSALRTDMLIKEENHIAILAAGLFGEAGSILAELKKEKREQEAEDKHERQRHDDLQTQFFCWRRLN